MKASSDPLSEAATRNAHSSIKKRTRLPDNVFAEPWDDYLFLESYPLFDPVFIEANDIIISAEMYSKIAVVNLGNSQDNSNIEFPCILLDNDTTWSEYFSILKGDGSPDNWMFLMDRYVFASDIGNWRIYCEKENDIAIFVTGRAFPTLALTRLKNLLKAKSIRSVSDLRGVGGFEFDGLVPGWKAALLANFGS